MITINLADFICILRAVTNVVVASNRADMVIADNFMSSRKDPFYLPKSYNKNKIPVAKNDGPINITVFVEINSIDELSENDSSVTFNIKFRLSWVDDRLILNHNSSIWTIYGTDKELHYANIDPRLYDYIWKPDFDIVNLRRLDILDKNREEHDRILKVSNGKRLWYEISSQVTLFCPLFDFKDYPFDSQVCVLLIGSLRYPIEYMIYNGYLIYNTNNQRPPQYDIKNVIDLSFGSCVLNYEHHYLTETLNVVSKSFQHSHFGIKMEFQRVVNFSTISMYISSTSMVLLSWLGFFLSPSLILGRLLCQITSLITLLGIRYCHLILLLIRTT